MAFRRFAASPAGLGLHDAMARLNARHPWSHNDHFIGWMLSNLPQSRGDAVDIGCGRGELAAGLAPEFRQVLAVDADAGMAAATRARCAGLPNVQVAHEPFDEVVGAFDLVTMICVLHHLDVGPALRRVRDLLNPGGRFLMAGLAEPVTVTDHLWDAASILTNPVIGYVKHPWVRPDRPDRDDGFPVKDPALSFGELRDLVDVELPGATVRHHLGFRHTVIWQKPQ